MAVRIKPLSPVTLRLFDAVSYLRTHYIATETCIYCPLPVVIVICSCSHPDMFM
jgi:hypothetical protein